MKFETRRRTLVPMRPVVLEAHRWWTLGGRTGAGQLKLSSVDLRCVWLAAAELSGLELHDAELSSACFESSRFDEADLDACCGSHVDFRNVSLRGALIDECRLTDSCFDFADLSRARLIDTALAYSTFTGTHWLHTVARRVDLRHCRFIDADLDHAMFVDCDLRGARFLGGTQLGLRLERCRLEGAIYDAPDFFSTASLFDCRIA